ncbi:MAG TPA: hypothetical protein VMX97_09715, partial [Hyphomicrobiaceae bacterium]|nr:hypothetical protein [Hyphomicrobiaceae bacterium]
MRDNDTSPSETPAPHAVTASKPLIPHQKTLVLRFILVNAVGVALLLAAYAQGWLAGLFGTQMWVATVVIFAVFLYGLGICGIKIWQTSVALDGLHAGTFGPETRAGRYLGYADLRDAENRIVQINLLRMRLGHKISVVRQIANMLV